MTESFTITQMTPDDLDGVTINARQLLDAIRRVEDEIEQVRFDAPGTPLSEALGYKLSGIGTAKGVLLRMAYAAIVEPQP